MDVFYPSIYIAIFPYLFIASFPVFGMILVTKWIFDDRRKKIGKTYSNKAAKKTLTHI
jgi:hypothetical protein